MTEASPRTRRLVLRALEAGECLSAFKKSELTGEPLAGYFYCKEKQELAQEENFVQIFRWIS
ncbi:hypothetical protein DW974_03040 [Lachnospiraceae bacterium AM48-27BH]|nr:hypothetical protein DW974_03040 [Lachnospiraceae bacterium AM48-27BH]